MVLREFEHSTDDSAASQMLGLVDIRQFLVPRKPVLSCYVVGQMSNEHDLLIFRLVCEDLHIGYYELIKFSIYTIVNRSLPRGLEYCTCSADHTARLECWH